MLNKEYKAVYVDEKGDKHTVFVASSSTIKAIDTVLDTCKNARRVVRCCPCNPA
tara:strand:+ start:365 stop:526 length:162 start_codon:yes stop_codon:yes gene_type:complete